MVSRQNVIKQYGGGTDIENASRTPLKKDFLKNPSHSSLLFFFYIKQRVEWCLIGEGWREFFTDGEA